jgi:uncharacterized membrane protein YphA (DoxX/SURF4 family)
MNTLLRLFLGIVVLSAGTFRALFFESALKEAEMLGLPFWFSFFIIIFEIVCGILLIFNIKIKLVLSLVAVFLTLAIIIALIGNAGQIIENAGELFVFDSTPTDIFLHITYLVIIFALIYDKQKGS